MELIEESIFPEYQVIYANFGQRLAAVILDWLILFLPSMFFGLLLRGIGPLLNLIMTWLYFALQESGGNQATIGKKALGIKVTDMNGNRISFGKATGRYFGKIISAIILLIGYFMNIWDEKGQTLHDKMAETLVVKKTVS